jgi:hypothetical protein
MTNHAFAEIFRRNRKSSHPRPQMRAARVRPGLLPQIQPQSPSNHLNPLQCRRFHSVPPVRFPNRYSKRPAELPKPASKPPKPPPTDPNHGLWAFFRNKRSLTGSNDVGSHGTLVFLMAIDFIRTTLDSRRIET